MASGLRKLKKVKVKSQISPPLEKIEIDVVSLQTFSYSASYKEKTDIDLTSCKNLEVFKYKHGMITEDLIQGLNCNFPALKVLVLHGYRHHIQRIEISIPLLEKLNLSLPDLSAEEAIINAPRLRSFKCYMENIPPLFSLNQTSLQEVALKLSLDLIYFQQRESFREDFMEIIESFNQIKLVTLRFTYYSSSVINKIVSKVSNPVLLDIRHLKLKTYIDGTEKVNVALVDDLFCICRPESLLLVSGCGGNDAFMKILCKKLVRRVKHKNYSAAAHVKCWQRDLKGVKIEHFGRNGYKKVVTCHAFLDSFQILEPKQKIRFVFEW
uniref:FBD domain-containing protein n=1 Tax=Populus trichocarpa TaxID=3694 RepID=A0A3N7G5C2_POPTR